MIGNLCIWFIYLICAILDEVDEVVDYKFHFLSELTNILLFYIHVLRLITLHESYCVSKQVDGDQEDLLYFATGQQRNMALSGQLSGLRYCNGDLNEFIYS